MRLLIIVILILNCSSVFASGYKTNNPKYSPHNPNNSVHNPQNSPHNPNNSVYNPNNSPYNPNASNAVYDNSGNRMGYKTDKAGGGFNYYDNQGNRTGYGD
jgi:hypothetical protein